MDQRSLYAADGQVYAFGYLDAIGTDGLRRFIVAPINGGKIEPGFSGKTDLVKFFGADGNELVFAYGGMDRGWTFQSQAGGGQGSNVIRVGDKPVRNSIVIFSTEMNPRS